MFDNLKPITPTIIARIKNIIKDKEQNKELQENGWLVLRYWEHEINNNIEGVVDEIEDILILKGIGEKI